MKIIAGLRNLRPMTKGSVVTIGVFDGVHIGHRRIIDATVAAARRKNLNSVVVTFEPHPLKILRTAHDVPSLISLKHRIGLIEQRGVDILVILRFTYSLSALSPERFVRNILRDKLGAREICVGENFYFGRHASAGVNVLEKLGAALGINVRTVRPLKVEGDIVSSSLIRRSILNGDIRRASRFLGRPVSVLGTVVKGESIARHIGFPTANINPHHEVIPPKGVYAVKARLDRRILKGILNIGFRPTFYSPRDREPTIELHIFGFRRRIYGRDIEVFFVRRLRDELKFKNSAELAARIRQDEKLARSILR